jgi:hypothetical protein
MATRKLGKELWQTYFDAISKGIGTQQVEIEVAALGIGDQIASGWVPLSGLVYDPHDDALVVRTESIGHVIRRPREIHVVEEPGRLTAVEAIDGDGIAHIVRLRVPPAMA